MVAKHKRRRKRILPAIPARLTGEQLTKIVMMIITLALALVGGQVVVNFTIRDGIDQIKQEIKDSK